MQIGENIRTARMIKGLSQKGLADKVGLSEDAVQKWERSKSCPTIDSIPYICQTLGVSAD